MSQDIKIDPDAIIVETWKLLGMTKPMDINNASKRIIMKKRYRDQEAKVKQMVSDYMVVNHFTDISF